jgi:1,4-alpha-glucan branching enzyme
VEKGYLAIVLHAHLPFVRHPEHEDSLEENWLYEAITETYIPLLLSLDTLAEQRDFRLTFSITPTLASMLDDQFLRSRYLNRLEKIIELARKEIKRTRPQPEFNKLAHMYYKNLTKVRTAFLDRYDRNLIQAFKRLQDLGKIEIIASAATHGYLPLLSLSDAAVRAQIQVGIEHYQQLFGRKPMGFWLPECGFYPGADDMLKEQDIRYTIVETHGITHGHPRPNHGVYAPVYCPSGLAVFGRDPESSKQVWSSAEGYPGDYDYREFYRDIAYDLDLDYIKPYIHRDGIRFDTGFKYFRITGKTDIKEVYIREAAEKKAEVHAGNFIFNREKKIEYLSSIMDRKPIVVAPYDAELFGHWWHEGPMWLDNIIRKVGLEQNSIRLITLSEYLEEYPINQVSVPSASSWGYEGFHTVWLNGNNDWIYPHLHRGALIMEKLAKRFPSAKGLKQRALKQAARELLLAQASDWAFMLHRDVMAEYAAKRVKTHMLRLLRLREEIETGKIDRDWLSMIESQDNIFPQIDYKVFSQPKTCR